MLRRTLITALVVCLLSSNGLPTQSRDRWTSIRTHNLFLISNAEEQDLSQVAVWLELFHEAFARILAKSVIDSSVPTTVVVFKDHSSFTPFKPLHQGKPANVAGYFQPGQDVNYIALTLERGGNPLGAAFHEYVHLHIKDNVPDAPPWLNEGLAEYYGAFSAVNGEAVFGSPLRHYLQILRSREFLPLTTLFSIGYDSPHYNEQDKSGVFYAESWALIHYLMMGDGGLHRPQVARLISLLSAGVSAANAIQTAFGMGVETLEKELKLYVNRDEFGSQRVTIRRGPDSYVGMQRASISEADANFYLGDLLLHIHRQSDAEKYLLHAISLDSALTSAHASLGLLRVQQDRLADAKRHLQRATSTSQNYLVHYYYAWVLSQERTGPDRTFAPEDASMMRDELGKAIKLAPKFADAYYLLAYVNVVNGEQLEEAVNLVKRAQSLVPGRLSYSLLLAFAFLRQQDIESARPLLESLVRQNSDLQVRAEAQRVLDSINSSDGSASSSRVGSSVIRNLGQPGVSAPQVISGEQTARVITEEGQPIEKTGASPSVDQIIESWIEAMGGSKTLLSMTSRVVKGTVDVVGVSRGGSIEIYSKAPNKTLTIMRANPMGEIKLGFNGSVGWEQSVRGLRLLKGPELDALRRDSNFYSPVGLKSDYQSIELLGRSKIGYLEIYALELKPKVGADQRLYIDAKTNLPIRLNAMRATSQGSAPVEVYFDDWREVDGLKMPFRTSQRFPKLSIAVTVAEIQHNITLNDSIFESPTPPTPLKRKP